MGRESDISALGATVITIPAGATAAVLIQAVPTGAQALFKQAGGSTLYFFGVPGGASGMGAAVGGSVVGTSLISGASFGYLLGASEVLNLEGQPNFYVASPGATGSLYMLVGKCGQWL